MTQLISFFLLSQQLNVVLTLIAHTTKRATTTNVSIHALTVVPNVAVMLNALHKIIEPIASVRLVCKEIH